MSEQEQAIVNNIANKLEIILRRDQITVLALSKLLKVDKQPIYRIMKREHIPNILFLEMIANYLRCNVLELIDKKFFLDINSYYDINHQNQDKHEKHRIYVDDENFMSIADNEFFGIIKDSFVKIFYKTNKISHDGYYLIQNDNNTLEEINILSVGTNLIIALINNKEVRLNPDTTMVTAKLYKTVSIIQSEGYALKY